MINYYNESKSAHQLVLENARSVSSSQHYPPNSQVQAKGVLWSLLWRNIHFCPSSWQVNYFTVSSPSDSCVILGSTNSELEILFTKFEKWCWEYHTPEERIETYTTISMLKVPSVHKHKVNPLPVANIWHCLTQLTDQYGLLVLLVVRASHVSLSPPGCPLLI